VAIVGGGTSIVIGKIIERHHKWSAYYIKKYCEHSDRVFPAGDPLPSSDDVPPERIIDRVPAGTIGDCMKRFCQATLALWVSAATIALIFWAQQ
jgi:hypothetical protein